MNLHQEALIDYSFLDSDSMTSSAKKAKPANHLCSLINRAPELILSLHPTSFQEICCECYSFDNSHQPMISCSSCSLSIHHCCISPNFQYKDHLLGLWRCINCLVCVKCELAEPEHSLMVCDSCQLGYHTHCLEQPLNEIPKGEWICEVCVGCRYCQSRSPAGCGWAGLKVPKKVSWSHDYLCYECNYLRENGNICPVCDKLYAEDDWGPQMINCDNCEVWVHLECDKRVTKEMYESLTKPKNDIVYLCPSCYNNIDAIDESDDPANLTWTEMCSRVSILREELGYGEKEKLEEGEKLEEKMGEEKREAGEEKEMLDEEKVEEKVEEKEEENILSFEIQNATGVPSSRDRKIANYAESDFSLFSDSETDYVITGNDHFKGFTLHTDAHISALKRQPKSNISTNLSFLKTIVSFCKLADTDCVDSRICLLCSQNGDKEEEGRLLPLPSKRQMFDNMQSIPTQWVHIKCFIYSPFLEFYDEFYLYVHQVFTHAQKTVNSI